MDINANGRVLNTSLDGCTGDGMRPWSDNSVKVIKANAFQQVPSLSTWDVLAVIN